jgi:hypothetical protein
MCVMFFFSFYVKPRKSKDKFQESCLFYLISIIMQRNKSKKIFFSRTLFMPLVSLLLCAHMRALFIMYFSLSRSFFFRVCVMQFGLSSLSFFRNSFLFSLNTHTHAHILPSSFFQIDYYFCFACTENNKGG